VSLRRRRARGMTLLELIAASGLLMALLLLVYHSLRLAHRWEAAAGEAAARLTRTDALRGRLARAVRGGLPVSALAVDEEGRLTEEPASERKILAWEDPGSLVLRGARGYRILSAGPEGLLLRRVGHDGAADREVVDRGVRAATFTIRSDAAGRPVGLDYALDLAGGEPVAGFVAVRVAAEPGERSSPPHRPAPRWRSRGGD